MRTVFLLIGLGIFIMMLPFMILGLDIFRSRDFTEEHLVMTDSNPTAEVVLALPLYDGDVGFADVTSDYVNDLPIPYSYEETTQTLTVSGLSPMQTRTLTIDYKYNRLEGSTFWVADLAAQMNPALWMLAAVGIIGIAIYGAWPRRGLPD